MYFDKNSQYLGLTMVNFRPFVAKKCTAKAVGYFYLQKMRPTPKNIVQMTQSGHTDAAFRGISRYIRSCALTL
jgi:hypothetical protein